MKFLVFLQGTVLMHRGGVNCSRTERVAQVRAGEPSVLEYASYVPIGGAAAKIANWVAQGAQVFYISAHDEADGVAKDKKVLKKYGFPEGPVCYCRGFETYQDVARRVCPAVIIEDDCESIGGVEEMIFPLLEPEEQEGIRSVVVQEFGGIDHLPDDVREFIDGAGRVMLATLDR